jgi:hypothetical protein
VSDDNGSKNKERKNARTAAVEDNQAHNNCINRVNETVWQGTLDIFKRGVGYV